MGSIARGKLPHLIEDLLRAPSAYSAFQALHLIEASFGEGSATEEDRQGFFDLAPAAEMTFPAGEIRHCRLDERDRYRLEVNFMGFYGVDSPLPQFFNDIATFDTPHGAELRGFFDLFNRRLYQLLYRAWKKMSLHGSDGVRASLYHRYLEALNGGLCRHEGRLDYAGILATRIKNGQSLAGMLEDFLDHPVVVKENIPCWIDLEEKTSLGGDFALGDNAMLGCRIMDVNSKILLRIGPMPSDEAAELLPGRPAAVSLAAMIRDYLDPTLEYDVEMLIQPDADYRSVLGGAHSVLGWTACLGRAEETINRVRVTGDSLNHYRKSQKAKARFR